MDWCKNRALIPNQVGQLLRVRLLDGREVMTVVDFSLPIGHHLRGVAVGDVAEWQLVGRTPYVDPKTGHSMNGHDEVELDMFGPDWCSRH